MRLALALQLLGFAPFGLLAGAAFAYRVERERQFAVEMLMLASVHTLTEIPVGRDI